MGSEIINGEWNSSVEETRHASTSANVTTPYVMACLQAATQLALYFFSTAMAPQLLEPKRRAYVLCFYVSAGSSIASLVYLPDLFLKGFELTTFMAEDSLSRFTCVNFIVYLMLDLVVGIMHYPKYLQLITSWIHHPAYIGLLVYACIQQVTLLFMVALPLEIPTLVLSVGTIWPHLRSDMLFGATFLMFRIIYHVLCLSSLYFSDAPQWMWQVCALALVPHCHWFYQWLKKYWLNAKPKQV